MGNIGKISETATATLKGRGYDFETVGEARERYAHMLAAYDGLTIVWPRTIVNVDAAQSVVNAQQVLAAEMRNLREWADRRGWTVQ